MEYKRCQVIAEIGCLHLGCPVRAKMLCFLAKASGADFVKTQKRNPEESTPKHLHNAPHPNPMYSYGSTYLEHRKNLELPIEEHAEIQKYCNEIGIVYTTSVWDITSAREVIALNPPLIKVPSACNGNWKMLDILMNEYNGQIHVSTGMTMADELDQIVDRMKHLGSRLVVYHCTSTYPCPFENLYLKEILKIRDKVEKYGCEVGFSNHGRGIAADIAAYTLGSTWIERHMVDDRTVRHTDSAASLEPDGLKKLCRDLHAVQRAMNERPVKMDEMELEQRNKLRYKD